MSNKIYGVLLHVALLVSGAYGAGGWPAAENLFTFVIATLSLLNLGAFLWMDDATLIKIKKSGHVIFSAVFIGLITAQVITAIAAGWFVLGGVYAVSVWLIKSRIYLLHNPRATSC